MTKPICLAVDDKVVQRLDAHQLRKSVSRSGVMRIALNEYLDRESEKADKNKTKGEVVR